MKRGFNLMKKIFILTLLLMVFGWGSLGLSFEPCEGEITRNVKLREAPGLDQRVLTVIKRGDKVKVLDQKEDWYLVSIKGKKSEIKAWVFANFIKLVAEKAEAAQMLTSTKEEAKKIESPLEGKEKIIPAPPETKEVLPLSEAREETEPQAGAAKEITQTPQIIGKEQQGEPIVVSEEGKNLEPFPQAQGAIASPEKSSSPAGQPAKMEQKTTPVSQNQEAAAGNAGIITFLKDLLRGTALLATVILSSLAFIFSFRAYRIVRECYQSMIRFQVRWQNLRDKEREEK
jgi:hypothetical protein